MPSSQHPSSHSLHLRRGFLFFVQTAHTFHSATYTGKEIQIALEFDLTTTTTSFFASFPPCHKTYTHHHFLLLSRSPIMFELYLLFFPCQFRENGGLLRCAFLQQTSIQISFFSSSPHRQLVCQVLKTITSSFS